MARELDFTWRHPFTEVVTGFYLKQYDDGESLVKIFFDTGSGQDEVSVWLSADESHSLAEFLKGESNEND